MPPLACVGARTVPGKTVGRKMRTMIMFALLTSQVVETPKKNASVGTLQIRCPTNSLSFRDIRNYKYLDFIIISKLSKLIFLSHKICVNKKVVTLYIYI